MTAQYPPQPPQQPFQPAAPEPNPPAPKKPNPLTSKPVIGIAALVVGLVVGSAAAGGGKTPTGAVAAAAPTVTVTATYEASNDTSDGDSTAASIPTKDDFEIKLKVVSKECFGSAGCNIKTKASVTYVGAGSTDDLPSSIDITYKIKGGEDPYTATIEMQDGQYTPDQAIISTRRSSDKLTAVVTDVESS